MNFLTRHYMDLAALKSAIASTTNSFPERHKQNQGQASAFLFFSNSKKKDDGRTVR